MVDDPLDNPPHGHPLHVLVIEDEPLIAMLLEDTLLDAGATSVAIAISEGSAISSARDHRPDFITSDMRLHAGTGLGAVRLILKEHGPIPTLFITSLPETCELVGPSLAVMTKPFRCDRVAEHFLAFTSSG